MVRANTCEPLINVVTVDKPKMLTGLNQKVRGRYRGSCTRLSQTPRPPADRRSPPHPGTEAERGKPVALPSWESAPQGAPTGRRVEEDGGSEGRAGNGADRGCDITPRESGPTSIWSLSTRELGQPAQEAKQMTAASATAGHTADRPAAGAASRDAGTGRPSTGPGPSHRASAPSPYRAGDPGGPVGQGQSLATPADPLVQRQRRWPCDE